MSFFAEAAVFLTAAVIAVPISRRLGLGAVLGYLAAGAAIGPSGIGLMVDVGDTLHFGEFGVVLLLFIIGLELQSSRLWAMRKSLIGLGGAQVALTGLVLGVAGWGLGLAPSTAAVLGLTLALSSTAFALQTLAEKNQLTTRHGRAAFAILLFQDLAAIPLLALVPLLAPQATGPLESSGWQAGISALGILAAVAVGGRYLLRYVLRAVAQARIPEVFTAVALLVVVGAALLMQSLGLSAALGAFVAGVLLADSEYRHALEADIEPFKGLLLGLFFIAVGMSLNLGLIAAKPGLIAAVVVALVAVKFAVLFALGRLNGLTNASARSLAIAVSQGGEFAFVILGIGVESRLIGRETADLLIASVTLSMAVTPLLFALDERLLKRRLDGSLERAFDTPPDHDHPVIIAGFGRFGQIIARILSAKKIAFTALEISPEQVDFVRRYGNEVYYGDASRLDLLRAAKADGAAAFVLAIDDVDASLRTAETVRTHFPNLKIYARARNRQHAYRLMDLGVSVIRRETFLSSLDVARELLKGLGLSDRESERAVETFRRHDEQRLYAHHGLHNDEERMRALAKEAAVELEEMFARDAAERAAG